MEQQVKLLTLGHLCPISVLESESQLLFLVQPSATAPVQGQQLVPQVLESLPPMQETLTEYQAPGFNLAHLRLLQTSGS